MMAVTPPSPLFPITTTSSNLSIQLDADRRVPIRHLCNLLLSLWAVAPKRVNTAPSDTAFVQYTYDATLFDRDPFYGGAITAHVPLCDYLQRQLCFGTASPFPCAVLALRLIDGYHKSTMGCVNYNNAHLLFATALMIATKAHCDEVAPWSYTQQVVGVGSALLSNLEVIMLFENRLNVIPTLEEYRHFRSMLLVDAPPPLARMHLSEFKAVCTDAVGSCEELQSYDLGCHSIGGLSDDTATPHSNSKSLPQTNAALGACTSVAPRARHPACSM